MKDFFQRKILSQLVRFLCYLEALMQVSWNLEILSDDLIQVFHLTARKQHCQVTCHHPPGHSIHSWARLLSPPGQVQGKK